MSARQRVALLLGGRSSEREISLRSGRAVGAALERLGHDVVRIDLGEAGPDALATCGCDVAFIALHGRYGEDGCVQGLLEMLGIPYTGSGVLASAVAMDKRLTKRLVAAEGGVRLAKDVRIVSADAPLPIELGLPVVVKPIVGGSTVGITIVRDASGWKAARDRALAEHPDVLVEAFIAGDEVTVTVIEGEVFPIVRIVPDGGFYDYDAKYERSDTRYEVPAAVGDHVRVSLEHSALAVYRALGCRGAARVDFIVPHDGSDPVMLEINTIPGMTDHSLVPMAAAAVGLDFDKLVARILSGARLGA